MVLHLDDTAVSRIQRLNSGFSCTETVANPLVEVERVYSTVAVVCDRNPNEKPFVAWLVQHLERHVNGRQRTEVVGRSDVERVGSTSKTDRTQSLANVA